MTDSQTRTSASILKTVRSRLASEPYLGTKFKPAQLALDTSGILTFEGEVDTVAQKKIALETAAALPEITGIIDRLHLRPAVRMEDAGIRAHLRRMFTMDPSLTGLSVQERRGAAVQTVADPGEPFGSLEYDVVDGIVTLNGTLNDLAIKRYVGVLAWWVPGVRDVINGIAVLDEADGPERIADAVRLVLEKNPYLDAVQIKVGVRNRVVRLTGFLPAQAQREMAENDAWCVFGVDAVINEILVGSQ